MNETDSLEDKYMLFGGPVDGCVITGQRIPKTIYCPNHPGYRNETPDVPWGVQPSHSLPSEYVLDGFKYIFKRYVQRKQV